MNNGNKINSQLLGFASLVFALDMMTPINYWLSLSTLVIRLHATRTNTMLMESPSKEGSASSLIFNSSHRGSAVRQEQNGHELTCPATPPACGRRCLDGVCNYSAAMHSSHC